jgi:hypothetical protein
MVSMTHLLDMNLTVVAAVMNYTEMEAKVREATNNEPYVTLSISAGSTDPAQVGRVVDLDAGNRQRNLQLVSCGNQKLAADRIVNCLMKLCP